MLKKNLKKVYQNYNRLPIKDESYSLDDCPQTFTKFLFVSIVKFLPQVTYFITKPPSFYKTWRLYLITKYLLIETQFKLILRMSTVSRKFGEKMEQILSLRGVDAIHGTELLFHGWLDW